MPAFLARPSPPPCPPSLIKDALSVACFRLISDVMMCIFSTILVEMFYGKIVVILILPIRIFPDAKYELNAVLFVLGIEREKPHIL